jgi:hypothetical protein
MAGNAFGPGAARPLELPFTAPGVAATGGATFSPDGRWIAYSSVESGQDQVYVRSFPDGQHKSQLSSDGGTEPRWRGDGQELYYLQARSYASPRRAPTFPSPSRPAAERPQNKTPA